MPAKTRAVSTRTVYVATRNRRSNGRRNGNGRKIPIAVIAGFLPGIIWASEAVFQGNLKGGMERIIAAYTGYEYAYRKWTPTYLNYGLVPVLGGLLIHGAATWLGLNRWLRSTRLPIEI